MQLVFKIRGISVVGCAKPDEKEPLKSKKKYKKKMCKWCGKEFTPTHSHHLYCSKQCRSNSDKEHTEERVRRYRKRYHGMFNDRAILNVGTSGLGEHRNKSFKVEHEKILKELQNLGLR